MLSTSLGLIVLGMGLACFFLRARWLGLVCAVLTWTLIAAIIADWRDPMEITLYAVREGCRGAPYLGAALFFGLSILMLRGFWNPRQVG